MDEGALRIRSAGAGKVAATERGWRLEIPPGTSKEYRLAQIDDYSGRRRAEFLWRPPFELGLRARVSSRHVPGTWGFGLWNDPFGLACGPTREVARLPALPQAAWFFAASSRSYLSLRDDQPANGRFAQVLRSQRAGSWLAAAAITLPIDRREARRRLSGNIREIAAGVDVDPGAWHRYEIRWHDSSIRFEIDGQELILARAAPRAPLGLVIWIDNQYAAFDPQGKLAWGLEVNPEKAWLEIDEFKCWRTPSGE